jgi:hypothetical protein
MIIEILKDAILANIGVLKAAPKGWHKRNCMLCHTQGHGKDTRHRFGIQFNPNSILMNCFNCGFTAGFTEGKDLSKTLKFFLKQIHIDDKLVEQIEFEIFKQKNQIQSIREGDEDKPVVDIESKFRSLFQKWRPIDLPEGSLPITVWLENGLDDPDFLAVVNYALGRKIYNLEDFYWSPDTEFNVNKRLIIPYYYKGKTVGFTARLHYDTDGKSIPKYYQQSPTDFVYNLDHHQDWLRKYVLVNEGVLDAWSVDGISSLGEMGQAKIDIINRLQKEVIVCPDRDKKGWDMVKLAIDNNWSVAFPKWDISIKDAAHASEYYGRLLTTHSIISTAVKGELNIKNKWDIAQNARNRVVRYE